MDFLTLYMYTIVAILGICVGSFLNVVISRMPKGESVVFGSSHCPHCKKNLKWYELVPIFSYLFLRGKCSKCKSRISLQYPLIEAINGILWVIIFFKFFLSYETLLAWALVSALLALSVIDAKTREIPFKISVFIAVVALIRLFLNINDWQNLLLGAVSVSSFMLILLLLSGGRAIGGGDVKLMFGAGLYLGLMPTVLSFFIACIIASIIHIIKMIFFKANRDLALGPYLAVGIFVSLLWGQDIINFYMSTLLN